MSINPDAIPVATEPAEEWLTPRDICNQLHIPEQTFYQWRVKHLGPRAYRIGRHLRISRSDFDVWLASRLEV
jgi:excisionase family DNA binding protein